MAQPAYVVKMLPKAEGTMIGLSMCMPRLAEQDGESGEEQRADGMAEEEEGTYGGGAGRWKKWKKQRKERKL